MLQSRIIIQARTDSARLPAKALLPVAGMPSALLALRRAGNTGLDVRLATSSRPTDDRLARTIEAAGIQVFRGSADNVRQRFIDACADLNDNAAVVRLTADNLLPDGSLIEEVLREFQTQTAPYLSLEMLWQNNPYGLSVEIFRLGALREVSAKVDNPAEREHVTPALRRAYENSCVPAKRFPPQKSAVRCTMDTFDDYRFVADCFDDMDDPVHVPWQDVLNRMTLHPEAPVPMAPGPGLVLGTAQIGAPYGSAVTVQPPARDEAIQIIRSAIANGACAIDTARAYPGAEAIVGEALKTGYAGRCAIVTKLDPLQDLTPEISPTQAADAAEISVLRSLNALGGGLPDLMLHRAAHLQQWDGAVWQRLLKLQEQGLIAQLGVSVQSPGELEMVLATPEASLVQMPCNLLDWRWRRSGVIERLAQADNLTVHVRSVLLQGTLARPSSDWPTIPGLDASALIEFLEAQVARFQRISIADLCIAWMRAQPWVDALVIGAERLDQLRDTLNLFSQQPLSAAEAEALTRQAPEVPEQFLDPAKWNQHGER